MPHDIAGSMTVQIKYYKICFSPPPSFLQESGSHSVVHMSVAIFTLPLGPRHRHGPTATQEAGSKIDRTGRRWASHASYLLAMHKVMTVPLQRFCARAESTLRGLFSR